MKFDTDNPGPGLRTPGLPNIELPCPQLTVPIHPRTVAFLKKLKESNLDPAQKRFIELANRTTGFEFFNLPEAQKEVRPDPDIFGAVYRMLPRGTYVACYNQFVLFCFHEQKKSEEFANFALRVTL